MDEKNGHSGNGYIPLSKHKTLNPCPRSTLVFVTLSDPLGLREAHTCVYRANSEELRSPKLRPSCWWQVSKQRFWSASLDQTFVQ